MLGPKHSYTAKERLYLKTHDLGDSIRKTFNEIDDARGSLRGYLMAVHIIVTGVINESIEAAALFKETVWNLLVLTLRGQGHTWIQNLPSACMVVQNLADEIIKPGNHDGFVDADFDMGVADQNLRMEWLIPMSPKFFRSGNTKGPKDGMYPLAAMGSAGELEVAIGALGGNWVVDAGTKLTVKILLHTYYTEDAIFPTPWRIHTESDDGSTHLAPKFPGKIDSAIVLDSTFGAFALPTGNPMFSVDGLEIQKGITGFELHAAHDVGRDRGLNDEYDNVFLPLVCPTSAKGHSDFPYGSRVVYQDCEAAHLATGRHVRYMTRRWMDLGIQGQAALASLMGVKINPKTEPDRLSLTSGGGQAGASGMPRARIMGMNTRVRGQ